MTIAKMVAGCLAFTPKQIEAALASPYAAYMDSLYPLWLAAAHPDIYPNGRPRARILTSDQRAGLMRKRVGKVADLLKPKDWHNDSYSPRSSQALFIEIVGVLLENDLLNLLHPNGVTRGCAISFEKRISGRTNFDAILRYSDGRVAASIEAKFTETGFNKCSYPRIGRCDGTWWIRPNEHRGCPMATPSRNRKTANRYWDTAARVFGISDVPPASPCTCPLWIGYQVIHNLSETNSADSEAVWVLIYDSRNPYFNDPIIGWQTTLSSCRGQVHLLTWQALFADSLVTDSPRIKRLKQVHGF